MDVKSGIHTVNIYILLHIFLLNYSSACSQYERHVYKICVPHSLQRRFMYNVNNLKNPKLKNSIYIYRYTYKLYKWKLNLKNYDSC